MKKLLLLIFFIAGSYVAFAQNGIIFKNTKHGFGKIPQDKPVTYTFTFTNSNAKPAIVENATAECGCTTPVYPKEPIMKGKTGTIKVTFNAAAVGPFKKNVTVKFAGIDAPTVLSIDGEVLMKKVKKA
jgi:hypothetical protein